jgi:hemerythrin-like domain-containing protein
MSNAHKEVERRRCLHVLASVPLVVAGCASAGRPRAATRTGAKVDEEISPAEDLMREHGVLERVLLVYEESARRIEAGTATPVEAVTKCAGIVRRFIEDYHERLEEEFLFPRFESAGRETELVTTLRGQHARGRAMTDLIVALGPRTEDGPRLAQMLRAFSRMYRPHAAREDTVLFPAFRELVGASAYRELGEQFENREHALFGENGFHNVVGEVASMEQALGIYDLSQF